jgi:hypothetical protein
VEKIAGPQNAQKAQNRIHVPLPFFAPSVPFVAVIFLKT